MDIFCAKLNLGYMNITVRRIIPHITIGSFGMNRLLGQIIWRLLDRVESVRMGEIRRVAPLKRKLPTGKSVKTPDNFSQLEIKFARTQKG